MSKKLVVVAAISLLSLSACSSEDGEARSAESTSSSVSAPATHTSTAAKTTSSTTSAPSAAGAQQRIAVDETIVDDVMGHTIKVTGVVRDFQSPGHANIPDGGGEWVLVEVDTTAGDTYTGGIKGGFKLLDAAGETMGNATTVLESDMTAGGFDIWEGVDSGEQAKGWIAFQVNNRSDVYQLQYKRLAASVIGSGDPIEEKTWEITLPSS